MTSRKGRAENARIIAGSDVCGICGEWVDRTLRTPDPLSPEVDHVVPLHFGGADEFGNKRLTHRRCNRAKSDKEFAAIIKRSGALR